MLTTVRTGVKINGKRVSENILAQVRLNQRIGDHHDFSVHVQMKVKNADLNAKSKEWIGQTLSIGFEVKEDISIDGSPPKEVFKGTITSVSLVRQAGGASLVIQGRSPTIKPDGGPNTRSFTDKGLQEIVNEVLGSYSFPGGLKVSPKNFKGSIPYTVQYKESDYDFVHRLAGWYGEWFFYDGMDLYFGKPSGGETVKLDCSTNDVVNFDVSVRAVPPKFDVQSYNYRDHKTFKKEKPPKPGMSALASAVYGISESKIFTGKPPVLPVNFSTGEKEYKHLIKRKAQAHVSEMVVATGTTRNTKLKLGGKINIRDSMADDYGNYVVVGLTHVITEGGNYLNHFEAIPVEMDMPPSLQPLPAPVAETQLAKVEKVDDEKSLGRVKVKFEWQEGTDEKTPWIRVASPYMGKDKGFYIIPEVGDQVLVAFENNHPERPYVLSGMYHGKQKPEWFDPKNKFKGFKSKGGNKWKFDDKEEEIQIHAPNSILETAGKKTQIRTGKKKEDSSIVMEEGKAITISTDLTGESTITIDAGDGKVHIKAKTIILEATELIELKSGKEVKINGQSLVEIKSNEVTTEGTSKVDTKSAQVNIKGSAMVDVKGMVIKLN